jgi:hypothetical protein
MAASHEYELDGLQLPYTLMQVCCAHFKAVA